MLKNDDVQLTLKFALPPCLCYYPQGIRKHRSVVVSTGRILVYRLTKIHHVIQYS